MLNTLVGYIHEMFEPFEINHNTRYGSELEKFIVAHNPKTIEDVEYLTREFDRLLSDQRGAWLWTF